MNKFKKKSRGSILVFASILFSVLLGFGALAVDLGHIYTVKRQLQGAADAAALGGAIYLFPADISGKPNFAAAQAEATTILKKHSVEGTQLTTATYTTGYWDFTQAVKGVTANYTNSNDGAAIQVTITKTTGQNGGPVSLYFARIFGINTADVTAHAVAAVGSPANVPAGTLFPLAMSQSEMNAIWNSSTNSPVLVNGSAPNVTLSSSNLGWSSFNTNSNAASTIQGFIANGNPISYKLGDPIYMQPGVKASIYGSVPTNKDVLLAVVTSPGNSGTQNIIAYVPFHLTSSNQGQKTITGHVNSSFFVKGSTSITGLKYGVYTNPKLVN